MAGDGQWRVYNHNRRARIRGNGGVHTKEELDLLFEQQQGICPYCGDLLFKSFDDPPNTEHKIPISRGGSNDISNIVIAHKSCNSKKGSRTADEFVNELKGDYDGPT